MTILFFSAHVKVDELLNFYGTNCRHSMGGPMEMMTMLLETMMMTTTTTTMMMMMIVAVVVIVNGK